MLSTNPLFPISPPDSVSGDGRFLVGQDGSPFIWIGDTAWQLFHSLDREEALHYLDTRAEQRFTLIQAVILAELDGLRRPNANGDLALHELDPTRPNEAYFQHVDRVIRAAAERGLVMGLLPTWGDKLPSRHPGAGPVIFNPANARIYGEYLGRRYRDQPVVWILGGDRNPDFENATEIWHSMAEGIREGSGGRQLITYHPRGASNSATFFHKADWLDFNMYQSGHSAKDNPVYDYAEASRKFQPRKPFVDGEPAYEDIAVRFWEYMDFSMPGLKRVPEGVLNQDGTIGDKSHFRDGFIEPHDVRRQAYWNLLAGAAGYTYGNNAVWQMYELGEPPAIPALTDWKGALRRPGAEDMRHLHALWEERSFHKLEPKQDFMAGDNPRDGSHRRAAMALDGSFAMVYLPVPGQVSLKLDQLDADQVRYWWFNPRDGSIQQGNVQPVQGVQSFTSPGTGPTEDWVLVLDAVP